MGSASDKIKKYVLANSQGKREDFVLRKKWTTNFIKYVKELFKMLNICVNRLTEF